MRHPNAKRLLRCWLQSAVGPLALPVVLLACTSCAGATPRATHPPAGPIHEYPLLTAASTPASITQGPDGALWFTEAGTSSIARITTTGHITEFSLPEANSGPGGITAGPDR